MRKSLLKQLEGIAKDIRVFFEMNVPQHSFYSAVCYLIDTILEELGCSTFDSIAILEAVKLNIAYRSLRKWYEHSEWGKGDRNGKDKR